VWRVAIDDATDAPLPNCSVIRNGRPTAALLVRALCWFNERGNRVTRFIQGLMGE
jgi:hypothetical protein